MSALRVQTPGTVFEGKPGTLLPNGALVLAASMRQGNEWVILAARLDNHGYADEYVTWKCSRPSDATDTVWGHYFDNLREAVADYYDRP